MDSSANPTSFRHLHLMQDIASFIYQNMDYKVKSTPRPVFSGADAVQQALEFCKMNPDRIPNAITRENVERLLQLFLVFNVIEAYSKNDVKKCKESVFKDSPSSYYMFVDSNSSLFPLQTSDRENSGGQDTVSEHSESIMSSSQATDSENTLPFIDETPCREKPSRTPFKINTPAARKLGVDKDTFMFGSPCKDFVPGNASTPTKELYRKRDALTVAAISSKISTIFGMTKKQSVNQISFSSSSDSSSEEAEDILDVDATRQLMLDRLLQLVDVSYLQDILEYLDSCDDKNYSHFLSSSSSLSMSCLSLQDNDQPLFNKKVALCLENHPDISALVPANKHITPDHKRTLTKLVLTELRERPLIPDKMADLARAVETLIMSPNSRHALDASFLFVMLLRNECRQRLKNAIDFLRELSQFEEPLYEPDNRQFLRTHFSTCFVAPNSESRYELRSGERREDFTAMLFYFMDHFNQIFVTLHSFDRKVLLPGTRKGVERGTFSVRVSPDQFVEQKRVQTAEELFKLVHDINKSTYFSIKQKNKLLQAVQRKHPDVFGHYFSHTRTNNS